MKNKLLLIGMLGCAALAACSDQDTVDEYVSDNAIKFNAVVPNGSRSASTTTATIKEFVVYAFTGGSTLMNGVKVTRDGGSWTYSPEAYWPVTPVNFYAFSPDITNTANITGDGGGDIPGYISDGQTDLLYAVKTNVSQQAAPVSLNFRHALSKVSMMLSSTNPRIKVLISHIVLYNIYGQGTFDFPTESTLPSTPDVTGSWTLLKNKGKMLTFYAMDKTDRVELTSVPTDYTIKNVDCSYVIPQPLTEVDLSSGEYTGTFISVECEIFDTATGAKLWPNTKTPEYMLVPETPCGRIVYPVTSDNVKAWLPGHAYIYNIVINNPGVLDKIEFDVTVDDYSIDEI